MTIKKGEHLMSKYIHLAITEQLNLIVPEIQMAEELFQLVDSDREHLRPFLSFLDSAREVEVQRKFIQTKLHGAAKGTDKLFFIAMDDKIIGSIDLHTIDLKNQKAEIGYWIHSAYTKQHITSKAVKRLCQYAFETLGLNKLTIMADTENIASNAVAKSCGFTLLGTRKQDIYLHDAFCDMNEYYLLK